MDDENAKRSFGWNSDGVAKPPSMEQVRAVNSKLATARCHHNAVTTRHPAGGNVAWRGLSPQWALAVVLALTGGASAAAIRDLGEGESLPRQAAFVAKDGEHIILKLASGTTVRVPANRFSGAELEFIEGQSGELAESANSINQALGFPAFTGLALAGRAAADLAKALELPLESDAPVGKSWRLYAAVRKPGYKLFGAVPYSVALYSDPEGKAQSISVIFANKGDYGSKAGFASEHFQGGVESGSADSLASAMKRDEQQIGNSISAVLGEGRDQRFGDSGTRRSARRWDWNDHSFLLSHVEGEYVSLLVVPTAQADAGGRTAMVSDARVRERLEGCIQRKDTGDVWISGIPMVDQGPKGYCVPATFERAMRHMGVEADMYLLAMVGQTGAGGGTSVELLMENLRSQVYRKGRRLKEIPADRLRIRDVKRHIDSGVPLLWRMCSMEEYNRSADENTAKRGKDDHAGWLEAKRAEFEKRSKPAANHHLCMIIGYNEATGELAVSDSWGKQFELRWVPVEVADWAHNGALVIIQP